MNNDIYQRKGVIVFSKNIHKQYNENILKEIFSNFFPLAITELHNGFVRYIGYSPHFEIVKESHIIPNYHITLSHNNDLVYKFDGVEKLDKDEFFNRFS
jgi:hypothetical protein